MAQKKKTTSTRTSKRAKAGTNRRDVYKPLMVTRTFTRRDGSTFEREVEATENIRRGKGSNRPRKYTGYPTTYYV